METKRYIDRLALFVESGYRLNLKSDQLHVLMLIESLSSHNKKLVDSSEIAMVSLLSDKQVEMIISELITLKYISIESDGKNAYYSTDNALNLLLATPTKKGKVTFKELFEAKLKRELKGIEIEIVNNWQEENIDFEKMSKILINVQFENDQIPFSLISELLTK